MIIELTPQQEAAISFYQQKWQRISRSTEPIDRDKATSVLNDVHDFYLEGDLFPEIIFFDSIFAALNAELEKFIVADLYNINDDAAINAVSALQILNGEGLLRDDLWFDLHSDLPCSPMDYRLQQFLQDRLVDKEGEKRHEVIWEFLKDWLMDELHRKYYPDSPDVLPRFYDNFIDSNSEWITFPGLFDFCINEFKCEYNPKQWEIYEKVITECGCWFLPGGKHWIICDRPIKLLLDEEGNLHAEGEPAIEYSDGFALYVEHGKVQSMVTPSK